MNKGRYRSFTDDYIIISSGGCFVECDVGVVVDESDVFVRVSGDDGERYSRGEVSSGGEIESGDFEVRDGEARSLRTVDKVNDSGCGGDEED